MKAHVVPSLAIALATLTLATGCSTVSKMNLGRVITSGRDGWQHPEKVIAALNLKPGEHVAEIGAGKGYWVPWLSEAVGPQGVVYAVEVTDELVDHLEKRAAEEGWTNVVVVRGEFGDPLLPDGTIDVAMTSQTYHHIEDQPVYFRKLQGDLSAGGRVAQLDDRHDVPIPIKWLQGSGHWTDPAVLRAEMEEASYRYVEKFDFLPLQCLQVFVPAYRKAGEE